MKNDTAKGQLPLEPSPPPPAAAVLLEDSPPPAKKKVVADTDVPALIAELGRILNRQPGKMNRTLLEKPFEKLKSRKAAFGNADYIDAALIIQRLNEAFEGQWSFEILEHQIHETEVLVLGKLTANGIAKSQFGRSEVTRRKSDQKIISIGDDLKAAATDSIKKCATLFGVGLQIYLDDPQSPSGAPAQRSEPPRLEPLRTPPASPPVADVCKTVPPPASPPQAAADPATAKQLSAISAIARRRGWNDGEIRKFVFEMFGKALQALSRREASSIIDHLAKGQVLRG
jgi:hypothetical protein